MSFITRNRLLALNYAVTIFVSAFLLFQVQPLISKYILPWFGGSPAVWTTCMLFFQSVLFAGYAYAHCTQHWLRPKQQAVVHLAIILMALLLLGIVPEESWKPQESHDPVGRILLLLAVSVGLPYFVLSTTGPLIQAWFARSFPGRTPYRLYALSNVGSLLALLSYPFFFERMLDVPQQAWLWSAGFVVFAFLCGGAAVALWGRGEGAEIGGQGSVVSGQPAGDSDQGSAGKGHGAGNSRQEEVRPRWWQRVLWLALPAFASVTLLAVTNHVCTDVAVMPFLWVVPLSLYLLTFIVAFDHPRWYRPAVIAAMTMIAIYMIGVGKGETDIYECGLPGGWIHWCSDQLAAWRGLPKESYPASPTFHVGLIPYLAINFVAMFGICMLCHGELVRQRPHPRYLTAFYLMISAGGAIGGIAVTLLAPRLFNTYFEWELSTFLGYLLCAGVLLWAAGRWAMARLAKHTQQAAESRGRARRTISGIVVVALLVFVAVVGWIDLSNNLAYTSDGVLHRARNFFGTLLVREFDRDDADHYVIFKHGATTHGLQFAKPERRNQSTTYYTPYGGVGRAVSFLQGKEQAPPIDAKSTLANVTANNDSRPTQADVAAVAAAGKSGLKIGAVGLGVGTLAAYVGPGESIAFYEINPAVIDIADSDRWFTYLADCKQRGGRCETKLGDARLTLERELRDGQPQHFDLLVLDAFSGDAIPVHLLTEEAFEKIYLPHLATAQADGRNGAIAVHITNHYVNLEPVIRGLAERFGLQSARIDNPKIGGQAIYHADWIILSKNKALIDALAPFVKGTDQVVTAPSESARSTLAKPSILWTDGRSNLFDVLK